MKKLFLILALLASLGLDAQGVYYYLPRNVIKLELTIEETNYHIGPYAEFASEMLGTNDYIKENRSEIKIKDVDIQVGSENDPDAVFFIEYDEKNKEPMPNIILDYDGVIKAIGYDNIPEDLAISRNTIDYNESVDKVEDDYSFVEVLTIPEDIDEEEEEGGSAPKKLTKEDKAKIAVIMIDKIRNAYFELISGYQEVSFGNTITYMADNMKSIEDQYVSLFKGKAVKNVYKKCFYLIPDKSQANSNVWVGKLDNGETLKIQFDTKKASANISPLGDDVLNGQQANKIYYRIPAKTTAKVTSGNNVIASKTLVISQFGELQLLPAKSNKILFNPNTGQIVTVSK